MIKYQHTTTYMDEEQEHDNINHTNSASLAGVRSPIRCLASR
jgi:hypothetical protein